MTARFVGVIEFEGDFDGDHPDEELRGEGPSMHLIASSPITVEEDAEGFCWSALASWTESHPLRRGETAQVLRQDW